MVYHEQNPANYRGNPREAYHPHQTLSSVGSHSIFKGVSGNGKRRDQKGRGGLDGYRSEILTLSPGERDLQALLTGLARLSNGKRVPKNLNVP